MNVQQHTDTERMNAISTAEYGSITTAYKEVTATTLTVSSKDSNQQALSRRLSTFATFGLAFSNMGLLANTSATFPTVLQRGGPVTMLICWNIVAFIMTCVALSLAEICSLYPTSGGLYYWVYQLLSQHPHYKSKASVAAFITGWAYAFANILSISATNMSAALSICSIIRLTLDIDIGDYSLVAMTVVITVYHGYLNTRDMNALATLNKWNVFWSCFGLILIIIVLAAAAHHQQLSWVFTHYENRTGIDNSGYVLVLGMVGAAYSLFGCESAASVSEETKDADRSSPIAMVSSIAIAWVVGFAYLIILLFSIQDIDAIFNTSFHLPVAQLFYDATGIYGTIAFLMLMIICQLCSGATAITVSSRQVYSLARDSAAPLSHQLKILNKNALPSNAVWLTVIISSVIILPYPSSEYLFETIVSATTIIVHFSYAMVFGSRLFAPDRTGKKGRFNIGRWSTPVTLVGFSWAIFAVFAFILPTAWPITSSNFNYAGLGLLFVLLFTTTFWSGWGRHHYHGPQALSDEAR